ncbi:MAG: TonB family protein [Proteiniphilum sp.]|jgi:TonB family protein|nr:TonB family protein [Proteiniphilum sp.]
MHPIFIYIIQVNCALVLFYLLYATVLKSDTFLTIRRFYFISSIVFSLVYPCFVVPGLTDVLRFSVEEPSAVGTAVFIEEPTFAMVAEGQAEEAEPFHIPWRALLGIVYMVVTLFFIFRFLWQLASIFRIRLKSKKIIVSGIEVYDLKNNLTPFSFLGMIFINSEMHSEKELAQIIIHEHTHVREKHSLDVMLIEILLLFSWWNPFVWLLKREMAMNLEYLADNEVLREGVDSKDYQYHLLRLTYHETAVQIVNNFNVSQLKQRIMMMNKTKSSTLQLAKYLLILPLVLLLVTANSLFAAQQEPIYTEAAGIVKQIPPTPPVPPVPPIPANELDKATLAQDPPPVKKEGTEEAIFVVVENQPEFPGGQAAMMKFLADSIRYPKIAVENGIQGRVICNFVVMKDGSVSDVQIVRGVDPVIDAEAVRVLKLMPDWKPGTQHGKAVNVRYTLPVVFSLAKKESKIEINELSSVEEKMFVETLVRPNIMFPGGQKEMFRFVSQKIKYPVEAQKKALQGVVNATFKVSDAGKISAIEAEPNAGDMAILGQEVLRVFQQMPAWVKDDALLVSGSVKDSDSKPLEGAAVAIKGTNSGTITDAKGGFQLKVPADGGILTISFVGYKTKEVPVSSFPTAGGDITMRIPIVFRLQGSDVPETSSGSVATPENAIVVVGYAIK